MEKNEIYIRTIATLPIPENEVTRGTKSDLEINKINLNERDGEKKNKLDKLLEKTNDIIQKVANSLGHSVDDVNNLSEMEIEFGIGISSGLNLGVFEIGSDQSIKVKIKLEKK